MASGHARGQLGHGVLDPLQGDLRVDQLGHAAVDDQVLMGPAGPEPVAGDVAQDGPDDAPWRTLQATDVSCAPAVLMAPPGPGPGPGRPRSRTGPPGAG